MSISGVADGVNDQILDGIYPTDNATKISDFIDDKTKIVAEIFANVSFYLSKIPFLDENTFKKAEKGAKNVKSLLALPSLIKGSMAFYATCKKGDVKLWKGASDAAYIVADAVETVTVLTYRNLQDRGFGLTEMPQRYVDVLAKIKGIAACYGLSYSIKENFDDLKKLEKINPSRIVHPRIRESKKAFEVKRLWIGAEISAKQHDLFKNITGLALTVLGLTVGYLPWTFAAIGSASIASKVMNYFHKADSSFWQRKYAELLSM